MRTQYEGQFSDPDGVFVDSEDNVYVVDGGGNNRIQKFDSNGDFITSWGSKGSGEGHFNNPLGIAIDSEDNVYVANRANNRIQVWAPSE